MSDEKPGIKDLFHTIKKSPALMVTVIAAILIVGYILIKNGPGAKGGTASTNATSATGGGQGSYIQPIIEPVVLQYPIGNGPTPAGGNVATGTGSTSGGSPGPTTGITMPPPSGGNTQGQSTIPSSGNGGFFGLLGANVAVNFQNRTYTNAQGQQVPIPIPAGAQLVQGSQNRVWYRVGGQQYLLTSGNGPASSQTVYQPGAAYQPASSNTTMTNIQQSGNVTNTPSTVPAHG